jgi:peroxiredoxin
MQGEQHMMRILSLLFILAAVAAAAGQAGLYSVNERKVAPDFVLQDASGKTAKLEEYRGKVVLLDFWATWCTGCKKEIPWFSEFQKTYGPKGFAVVGVSMDEDGWKALRPFLAEHQIPYRMLLGDEATSKRYGIESLPDTFLIDRNGKVAAAYKAVLVDKDNVEAQIKTLVSER